MEGEPNTSDEGLHRSFAVRLVAALGEACTTQIATQMSAPVRAPDLLVAVPCAIPLTLPPADDEDDDEIDDDDSEWDEWDWCVPSCMMPVRDCWLEALSDCSDMSAIATP